MDGPEPRLRGPYAKTPKRRREILRTAIDVFGEYGFRGSSIREIADRVGMSETAVIHHFGGKGKLLLSVLQERDNLDQDRDRNIAAGNADTYHRDIVAKNARERGVVRLYATLSAESTDTDHPANAYFTKRYTDLRLRLTKRFQNQQNEGTLGSEVDPAIGAQLAIAVMDGLQIQWLLDPTLDMTVAYDEFVKRYFGASAYDPG